MRRSQLEGREGKQSLSQTGIILEGLNAAQRAAVASPASVLQVLAPPGSGKTKTLTARVAYLLCHEGLQPWNVIVATFTVKAAREMKERIGKLIGDGLEAKLVLGTFHSIARRYLVRYGHLIGIKKGFGIADSADTLAIIKRIVKRRKLNIDPGAARSRISNVKAQGLSHAEYTAQQAKRPNVNAQEFAVVYEEYENVKEKSNLLDYDDLLVRCVDLLRQHPSCVSNVEAVLIDEFQDTNLVQFDLMRLFAAYKKRITIVGDPDQSIYGFRSAEIKNLKRMTRQYPDTLVVLLEENYRSSGAILLAALEVIQQDESRPAKALLATHCVGTRPILRKLPSAGIEALWIVSEIKRAIAMTGNTLGLNDVAILIRSASLSRHIESALGKSGIPYRMVGGHKFFDRIEVKAVLDYLRVISQPENNDALARIINVPPRRIGETTVKALLEEAELKKSTLWSLMLNAVQGNITLKAKVLKPAEQSLAAFTNLILSARKKLLEHQEDRFSLVDLVEFLLNKLNFKAYLEKSHPEDHELRWANVKELVAQAADFSDAALSDYEAEEALPEIEGLEQNQSYSVSDALSKFLANIALSSEVKEEEDQPKNQVTISTIHAAKGLEWPVVFIPAAYDGSIPHSRAEDTDEERRLLYVAMTRAKALLYMSCPMKSSQKEQTTLSQFLSHKSLTPHLAKKGPSFKYNLTQSVGRILNRECPSEASIMVSLPPLDSLEDDLWPTSGEYEESKDKASGHSNGNGGTSLHQQHALKRRRIDGADNTMLNTNVGCAVGTTMQRTTEFSISTTTMTAGFVSAGLHMQDLDRERLRCVADKERRRLQDLRKPVDVPATFAEDLPLKVSKARPNRRPEGQASLMSFFGSTTSTMNATTVSVTQVNGRPMPQPKAAPKTGRSSQAIPSNPFYNTGPIFAQHCQPSRTPQPAISPDLANHRPRAAPLPHIPTSHTVSPDSGQKHKPYVFLSSSPIASSEVPQANKQNKPVGDRPVKANLPIPSESATTIGPNGMRPAATLHTTSMTKLNANGSGFPRKTLGVRRTMNGWSNRQGQGFVPPVKKQP